MANEIEKYTRKLPTFDEIKFDADTYDEYADEMYDYYNPELDEDDDGEYGLSAAERNR